MTASVLAAIVLPAEAVDPAGQQQQIAGALPIAGIFVALLGVALFILWRSLNKQIRKIDDTLPEGPDDRQQELDRELTQEAVARGEQEAQASSADDTGSTTQGTSS